ncbi:NAC domain containing protein [Parasponia andersonii]|uniref:NAC domain containing protein n=1 Tax=Parasponia andersonii TaxID=3476 RepID=A0A2P5D6R8_PARAD|nr:NAC domain containing protein [Parasponia andersonii]
MKDEYELCEGTLDDKGREISQISLPLGYRFSPTDLESMWYLFLKMMNLPIPGSKNLFRHLVDADGNGSNDMFNEIDAFIEGKIPENQLFVFLPQHDESRSKNGLGYYCRKGGNEFWRVHSSKPFIHRTSERPLKVCGGPFMELFAEGKGARHKIGKKTRFDDYEGKEKPGIQTVVRSKILYQVA